MRRPATSTARSASSTRVATRTQRHRQPSRAAGDRVRRGQPPDRRLFGQAVPPRPGAQAHRAGAVPFDGTERAAVAALQRTVELQRPVGPARPAMRMRRRRWLAAAHCATSAQTLDGVMGTVNGAFKPNDYVTRVSLAYSLVQSMALQSEAQAFSGDLTVAYDGKRVPIAIPRRSRQRCAATCSTRWTRPDQRALRGGAGAVRPAADAQGVFRPRLKRLTRAAFAVAADRYLVAYRAAEDDRPHARVAPRRTPRHAGASFFPMEAECQGHASPDTAVDDACERGRVRRAGAVDPLPRPARACNRSVLRARHAFGFADRLRVERADLLDAAGHRHRPAPERRDPVEARRDAAGRIADLDAVRPFEVGAAGDVSR